MAVLWMDNFQQYGTGAPTLMTNGAYAEASGAPAPQLVADPDPTASGTVLKLVSAPTFPDLIRRVLSSSATTIGVMRRMWLSGLPASSTNGQVPAIRLHDISGNCICSIRVESDGSIGAFRGIPYDGTLGGVTGVRIGTSSPAIVANAWQHVEVKFVIDATVGSIEVRVATQQVLMISGVNTGSASCTQVLVSNGIAPFGGSVDDYVKDFVIWDSTGTINANFLGNCFVYSQRPNSDVSGTWTITGGAGSGWASINETAPDDDTKYVSSPWPAATADQFGLTSLPVSATGVKAMMPLTRSRKSDGGDGNLQTGLVSGVSTASGANRPISTAYTYYNDVIETDPATGVVWSVAGANAAKLKLDRTL